MAETATKDGKAGAPARSGGIQSLERAAAILDIVAASRAEGVALADLSERTGLHTSTAFHLLKTLEGLGYVERVADSKRYRIGGRIFVLAAGALDEATLLSLGTPVLERLSHDTGEAAHLAVRSGADIVLVARTAATGMLQMSERAGVVRPAHATAIGKLLLAQLPLEQLELLLDRIDLRPFTERTLTDRAALVAELSEVRETGVAHDRRELDDDVVCVAVPVLDFAGRCVAAMGVSGPVWRMEEEALAPKLDRLRTAAAELSGKLGATR